MNIINRLLLFLFCFLFAFGCKKFLDEDLTGKVVGNAVLKSQDGLDAALSGAYLGLKNTWSTGFLHSTATAVTMGGDDLTTHPASNKQEFREFDQFRVSSGNTRISQLYFGFYKTIQGANNVIQNYPETQGDQNAIDEIAGEAYFLRAFSYYWLVRMHGKIPVLTTPEFSMDLLNIGLTETTEVYNLIENDFKQAITLLPNLKRNFGRPNKGAAMAFLADVYLTEAGWPVKDNSKYALAAQMAKQVIDDHGSYGFQFISSFTEIFENDPTKNGTAEDIFNLTTNANNHGNANYGSPAMPEDFGGWDDYFVELNFFFNFPEGPRKDKTFRTEFINPASGAIVPYQNLITKHPHYGKFFIKGDPYIANSSLPISMMRYSHVLLIYAEATARSSTPDADSYNYLNLVRQRGGEDAIALGSLTPEAFADSVVQERAWEFAGERTRWFDLVRLEKVEEANANKNPGDLQLLSPITKEDYLFPLPFTETDSNPNLK